MSDLPNEMYRQFDQVIETALQSATAEIMTDAVEAAWSAGFQAGLQAGADRMRQAILRAAQMPVDNQLSPAGVLAQSQVNPPVARSSGRAPHGAVRHAISSALSAKPGSTEMDVGILAHQFEPQISPRSVGAELRRMKDRLYRVDRGLWFLMAEKPQTSGDSEIQKESAERVERPADLLNPATKEESDAPETAIAA